MPLRPVSALARSRFGRRIIRRAAQRHLDSLHFTLYANWDISRPDGKEKALRWLTDQVINVLEEM